MATNNNGNAREIPSPPSGVRGRAQYSKHRTRAAAARDFARQLRKRCTVFKIPISLSHFYTKRLRDRNCLF